MSFVHLQKGFWRLVAVGFLLGGLAYFAVPVHAQTVRSEPWSPSMLIVPAISSSTEIVPHDPEWNHQWYLRQIGAPRAWGVSTGTEGVIVAMIDGGVDIDHPDLR